MLLNELTITLGGRRGRLSVEALKLALENALEMLRSMEKEFTTAGSIVRWEIVRVRMRSPMKLTFAPRVESNNGKAGSKTAGRNIVKSFMKGIGAMEKDSPGNLPPHFNEDTVSFARKLVKSAEKEGADVAISSNKSNEVKLTEKTVRNADEMVFKVRRYADLSTIEGILQLINTPDHPSFAVWETLTNYHVECFVNSDQMPQCLSLFDKRVAVTGRVKYKDHIPQSVDVETISLLPGMDQILRLKDIPEINITEGLPSEEHVRRMRDA